MYIVVVDDDDDVLEWCRIVLEADGFAVDCFNDPAIALNAVKVNKPDIILSDLMMGNLDSGFQLAKNVKALPGYEDLPVIIMSAASTRHGYDFIPKNEEELQAMQIDAFLAKPVEANILLAKIRELHAKNIKG
ncbi:MAG: response regulator [Candidatus Hydrogenedens sp.]|jgi:CheY-like chemotaxis protein|nr:response regulator [Candidatus Hydrogenedens sp.]